MGTKAARQSQRGERSTEAPNQGLLMVSVEPVVHLRISSDILGSRGRGGPGVLSSLYSSVDFQRFTIGDD